MKLVWENVELAEVERVMREKQEGKLEFNALGIRLPPHVKVMGKTMLRLEQVTAESSTSVKLREINRFVCSIKEAMPHVPLVDIFILVARLLNKVILYSAKREEERRLEEEIILESVAREMGIPVDRLCCNEDADATFPDEENSTFPEEELVHLARTLKSFGDNSLEGLVLRATFQSIKLTESSWEALCEAFPLSMHTLALYHIQTTAQSSTSGLFTHLKATTSKLKRLELDLNNETDARNLADALVNANTLNGLEELWIWNKTSHLEFVILALENPNQQLLRLELPSWTWVPKKMSELLARVLQNPNCKLTHLRIRANDEGMKFMATALGSPNCSLRSLRLRIHTQESETEGLEYFMRTVPNSKLEDLTLDNSSDADESAQLRLYAGMGEALLNPSCKLINLTLRSHGSIQCLPQTFSNGLSQSATLQSLDIHLRSLTLNAQAQLGDAIRQSKLMEFRIYMFMKDTYFHEGFFEGVAASNIKKLELQVDSTTVQSFCRLVLDNPICNIEQVTIRSDTAETCKPILEVVDNNFCSPLQEINFRERFEGEEWIQWDEKAEQILKRNHLLQRVTSTASKQVDIANLFLCGSSGAGKTTIKHNLNRRFNFLWPACLQRHASTSGIELEPLSFKGTTTKLLIWDLAGQLEFHAFHHSFLRVTHKSVFLVVLKVTTNMDVGIFEMDVVYWLRFIASHMSSVSLHKPKVLIALNFFDSKPSPNTYLGDVVSEKVKEYQAILDVELADIFPVQAIKTNSLKTMKQKLGQSAEALVSQQHKVPGLFEDARDLCRKLRKSTKIMTTAEFGKKLLVTAQQGGSTSARTVLSEEDKREVIKFTLLFLHDMGDAVYFASTERMGRNVILDVEWFVHDVISFFIDPTKITWIHYEHQVVRNMPQVADTLKQRYGDDKVEFILGCLYEMGIILPMDDEWNGEWKPLPTKVIVPTLVKAKVGDHFPEEDPPSHYWGRRVECSDVMFKLFPAGTFTKIQSKVHQECKNPSFGAGDGWVLFRDNRVCVLVRAGGDTDSRMDRQWVDIMVMGEVPYDAEGMVRKMKMLILEICFGELEIGELKVLNTRYVKGRMHCNFNYHDGQRLNSPEFSVPLSEIEKEAGQYGLRYSHTWSRSEDDPVVNLLFPSEQENCIRKRNVNLEELCKNYESFVKDVYNTSPLDSPIPEVPSSFELEDVARLATYMQDLTRWQQGRNEQRLEDIATKLESLGKQVHVNTSRLLHSLKVDCPKYPYLVTEDNKFLLYVKLSTSVKVRYMCECNYGSHPVQDVEGVVLKLPVDWLKRWSPVLIPSLVILFTTTRVAATISNAGFMNPVLEESQKGMVEFLKGNMNLESLDVEALKKNRPTKKDVEEIFQYVQEQDPSRKIDDLQTKNMVRWKFGLEWSVRSGSWLCKDHMD